MAAKRPLRKIVDETSRVRCPAGDGLIREEVWEDEDGQIQRYNLAFINHLMTSRDNGRVLGYDNSHGFHHRHLYGAVEMVQFDSYNLLAEQFYEEVARLAEEKV